MKNRYSRWLLEADENKMMQRSTIWNMIASVLAAVMVTIFTLLITHIVGIDDTGVFSLSSGIAYQCVSVGNFGVRNFQASDVNNKFSFTDYTYLRIISSIIMYGMLLFLMFTSEQKAEGLAVIFLFTIFRSVEALEDLFHGEYQRHNRLDIGSVLLTMRNMIAIIVFVVTLLITRNLVITVFAITITTIPVFIFQNFTLIKVFVKEKAPASIEKVKSLFLMCLPICISNSINIYIVNAPKYAIDRLSNANAIQGEFTFLFLPVFMVSLLCNVVFRPYVTKLSVLWQGKEYEAFKKLLTLHCLIIFGLTVLTIAAGVTLGIPVLEFISGIQLSQYRYLLVVLLIGGGFNTLATYLTITLTVQREQKKLIIGYVTSFIVTLAISSYLVSNYQIAGASYLYTISNGIVAIIFMIITIATMKKEKKHMINSKSEEIRV